MAMFRALRHRNYRLWAAGALVSNTGTWTQRVAQDWLVLTVLTDHSAAALGLTTALQFAPMLVLSLGAGSLTDRFPKRTIILVTQAVLGALALALGVLVLTGEVRLWHVFAFALAHGITASVDAPSRLAFVSEMVPGADLPNAISLNVGSFNLGRLLGPAAGGLLIAWLGVGPAFLVNAASFGAVLVAVLRIRVDELDPTPPAPPGARGVLAGLAHVRRHPDVAVVLALLGVVASFGLNFQVSNALMTTTVFHRGPDEYGLLGSMLAAGAVVGALLSARRPQPDLRVVVGATVCFGLTACVSAVMPGYLAFAITLVPLGLFATTVLTTANARVQLSAEPGLRGRVVAVYLTVQLGGTAIGGPMVGWLAEWLGARGAVLASGVAALVAAVAAAGVLFVVRRRARVAVGP